MHQAEEADKEELPQPVLCVGCILLSFVLISSEWCPTIRKPMSSLQGGLGLLPPSFQQQQWQLCYETQPSQVPPRQLIFPPTQARKQVLLLVELPPRALMEALDFLQTLMCATQAPVWMEPPASMASTLSNAFAFPATEGTCVRSVRPPWLQLIPLTAAPPCSHTAPQKSWSPVLPSALPSSQWANL